MVYKDYENEKCNKGGLLIVYKEIKQDNLTDFTSMYDIHIYTNTRNDKCKQYE